MNLLDYVAELAESVIHQSREIAEPVIVDKQASPITAVTFDLETDRNGRHIEITGTTEEMFGRDRYVNYIVRTFVNGQIYVVKRRYREFESLYEALPSSITAFVSLPPKRAFGNFDTGMLNARAASLGQLLRFASRADECALGACEEFDAFLGCPPPAVNFTHMNSALWNPDTGYAVGGGDATSPLYTNNGPLASTNPADARPSLTTPLPPFTGSNVRIVSFKERARIIYYIIDVDYCGVRWSLHKRYSDFDRLHAALVDSFGHLTVPRLSGRRLDTASTAAVDHRLPRLEAWLRDVATRAEWLAILRDPCLPLATATAVVPLVYLFLEMNMREHAFIAAAATGAVKPTGGDSGTVPATAAAPSSPMRRPAIGMSRLRPNAGAAVAVSVLAATSFRAQQAMWGVYALWTDADIASPPHAHGVGARADAAGRDLRIRWTVINPASPAAFSSMAIAGHGGTRLVGLEEPTLRTSKAVASYLLADILAVAVTAARVDPPPAPHMRASWDSRRSQSPSPPASPFASHSVTGGVARCVADTLCPDAVGSVLLFFKPDVASSRLPPARSARYHTADEPSEALVKVLHLRAYVIGRDDDDTTDPFPRFTLSSRSASYGWVVASAFRALAGAFELDCIPSGMPHGDVDVALRCVEAAIGVSRDEDGRRVAVGTAAGMNSRISITRAGAEYFARRVQ